MKKLWNKSLNLKTISIFILSFNLFAEANPVKRHIASITEKNEQRNVIEHQKVREGLEKERENYRLFLENYQYILHLSSPELESVALKRLKKLPLEIVSYSKYFFIVRPGQGGDLEEFKKLIKKMKRGDRHFYRVTSDKIVFPKTASPRSIAEVKIKATKKPKSCQLNPHCQENRNPYWAINEFGALPAKRLVQKALEGKTNISNIIAKVGVVDSGFDINNQGLAMATRMKIQKGDTDSGSFMIDPDGHGTGVTSVVGAEGIGFAENVFINVYRVTKEYGGGSTSSGMLANTIIKACENNDIVNVSWGSLGDEIGKIRPEKALWYKPAMDMGCLVVKAAGNSGIKQSQEYSIPVRSPYFGVASVGDSGEESGFSSVGMIFGPGEGIFTLRSHQSKYSEYSLKDMCLLNNHLVGPIDGTSFAAPAVAAIFGQIYTILNAREVLPTDNALKIEVLKKVMLATGEISKRLTKTKRYSNAYVATIIASEISPDDYTDGIDSYLKAFERGTKEICKKKLKKCSKMRKCEDRKQCAIEKSEHMMICENKNNDLVDLFKTYSKMNEDEQVKYYGELIGQRSDISKTMLPELEKMWKKNLSKSGDISSVSTALDILLKANRWGLNSFISNKKIEKLVFNDSFFGFIDLPKAGAETVNDSVQKSNKFFTIIKAMPKDELIKTLMKIPMKTQNYGDNEVEEDQVNLLVGIMNRDSLFDDEIQNLAQERLKIVTRKWFNDEDSLFFKMSGNKNLFKVFIEKDPELKTLIKNKIKIPYSDVPENLRSILFLEHDIYTKDELLNISLVFLRELTRSVDKNYQTFMTASTYTERHRNVMFNYFDLAPKAIEVIIKNSSGRDAHYDQIKDFLLTKMPNRENRDLFAISKSSEEKLAVRFSGDKEFIKKYLKKQLVALRNFLNFKYDIYSSYGDDFVKSLNESLRWNFVLEKDEKVEIINSLKDEYLKTFQVALDLSLKSRTHPQQFKASKSLIKKFYFKSFASVGQNFISLLLKNSLFTNISFNTDVKTALIPFKTEILKYPSHYDDEFEIGVRKLFGISEDE